MPRRVLIASTLVLVNAAIGVWLVIAIWLPPGAGHIMPSTYSARPFGFRALYETMVRLEADVQRNTDPPSLLFQGDRRIVLLEPDLFALEREKGALVDMADWVRGGGQLVIVSASFAFDDDAMQQAVQSGYSGRADSKGGEDEPEGSGAAASDTDEEEEPEATASDEETGDAGDGTAEPGYREPLDILSQNDMLRNFGIEDLAVEGDVYDAAYTYDVYSPGEGNMITQVRLHKADTERIIDESTGQFAALGVDAVVLPEDDTAYFVGDAVEAATGRLSVAFYEREESAPIGLHYRVGDGDLVLLCQPSMFTNVALGEGDNAVAVARLVMGDGSRPVILDEYYKGLSIAGQPMALFGMYPYGLFLGSILLTCLVGAWSMTARLGPPLADIPPPRRSLVEYIGAMGMLFRRGGHTRFVLETCRRGVLHDLQRALFLPYGTPAPAVLLRLSRVDPVKALNLEEALRTVDGTLKQPENLTPGAVLTLMEKLEACRLNQTNRSAT